ncbi:hypothetical protein TYRP_022087 [Tyrophagus putrescentiae]|nr:hypothetical protein TYRP_022087 [Tyrophagus putrescentiae]
MPSVRTSFPQYSRCFYEMSREIFADQANDGNGQPGHGGGLWSRRHKYHLRLAATLTVALLYAPVRLLFLFTVMVGNFEASFFPAYRRHDVVLNYFYHHTHLYDPTILLVMYLFGLFFAACEWLTSRLTLQLRVWRFWRHLVVESQEDYLACQLESGEKEKVLASISQQLQKQIAQLFPFPLLIRKMFCSKAAQMKAFFGMLTTDLEAFRGRRLAAQLPEFPKLSAELCRRSVIFMLTFDWFFYYLQLMINISSVGFFLFSLYFYPDLAIHRWPSLLWVVGEFLLSAYVLLLIVRYACFFTVCVCTSSLTTVHHLNEQRRAVERLIFHGSPFSRPSKGTSSIGHPNCLPLKSRLVVERHLREHSTTTSIIITGNGRFFGSAMAAFVYTNIPINIFLLSRIVMRHHLTWITLATYWLVVAIQLLELVVIFSPMSYTQVVMHRPHKYDDLYGRLLSGPKLAITIGPLAEVTYFSTYELLLTYIAYLLLAFSQLMGG